MLSTQFLPEVRDWTTHTAPYFWGSQWSDSYLTNFGNGEGEAYGNVAIITTPRYFPPWNGAKKGSKLKSPCLSRKNFPTHNCYYWQSSFNPVCIKKKAGQSTSQCSSENLALPGPSPLVPSINHSMLISLSWKEFVYSSSTQLLRASMEWSESILGIEGTECVWDSPNTTEQWDLNRPRTISWSLSSCEPWRSGLLKFTLFCKSFFVNLVAMWWSGFQ